MRIASSLLKKLRKKKMKKEQLTILIALFIMFVATGSIDAQVNRNATARADVSARLVSAFSAVKSPKQNLGMFTTHYYGGKILPSKNGLLTISENSETSFTIDYAANFFVAGDKETSFSITLPNSDITLNNITNDKTIKVSNWNTSFFEDYKMGLLEDGYHKVSVEATLDVGTIKDNPVGIYTGIYVVTFDFN
jgi:hypothetical protein